MQLHIIQMLHFCLPPKCTFEGSLVFSCFFCKEKCLFPTKPPTGATVEMQPNEVPAVLKVVLQAYCTFS